MYPRLCNPAEWASGEFKKVEPVQETNGRAVSQPEATGFLQPQGSKKTRKVSFGATYVKEFSVEVSDTDPESEKSIEEVRLDSNESEEDEAHNEADEQGQVCFTDFLRAKFARFCKE